MSSGFGRTMSRREVFRLGAAAAGGATASALVSACNLGGGSTPSSEGGGLVFLSGQLGTTEEAEAMRRQVLAGFDQKVDFVPVTNYSQFIDRIVSEAEAGKKNIDVIGGLHGDFVSLAAKDTLRDMGDVIEELSDRQFTKQYLDLAKIDGTYRFVPWIQASYLMAANKDALKHLPDGADVQSLTYDQLLAWGQALHKATGSKRLGFPAGSDGLIKRFFQGYAYPSFTGGVNTTFKSADAVKMWQWFKRVWATSNPQSTTYAFMQEPLLSGEVWVAWDHAVRLVDALENRPDDFVIFPAPRGPKGLGFEPVLGGLAMPKNVENVDAAKALISYLTKPRTTATTLEEVAWFPPLDLGQLPSDLPPAVSKLAKVIQAMSSSSDALPSLLPVGLGEQVGAYDKVFSDTFEAIVLNNKAIPATLDAQGKTLQDVLRKAEAPCWEPDPAGQDICRVA